MLCIWVQSTIATENRNKICMCVVYNVVYMGTVNNSNNAWYVLVYNKLEYVLNVLEFRECSFVIP